MDAPEDHECLLTMCLGQAVSALCLPVSFHSSYISVMPLLSSSFSEQIWMLGLSFHSLHIQIPRWQHVYKVVHYGMSSLLARVTQLPAFCPYEFSNIYDNYVCRTQSHKDVSYWYSNKTLDLNTCVALPRCPSFFSLSISNFNILRISSKLHSLFSYCYACQRWIGLWGSEVLFLIVLCRISHLFPKIWG